MWGEYLLAVDNSVLVGKKEKSNQKPKGFGSDSGSHVLAFLT